MGKLAARLHDVCPEVFCWHYVEFTGYFQRFRYVQTNFQHGVTPRKEGLINVLSFSVAEFNLSCVDFYNGFVLFAKLPVFFAFL